MQEIHAKLLISRLSLVQNIFYHYIHGMKRLIIPIICMLLSLAGCHERKPLPSLELADSLLTDAGDKSGALRIFLQIEEQLQSRACTPASVRPAPTTSIFFLKKVESARINASCTLIPLGWICQP